MKLMQATKLAKAAALNGLCVSSSAIAVMLLSLAFLVRSPMTFKRCSKVR